MAEGERFELSN